MSQRAEKYSRDMGRRLDKLENVVGSISARSFALKCTMGSLRKATIM